MPFLNYLMPSGPSPTLSELINAALIFAVLIVIDRGLNLKKFCGTNLDVIAKSILERTVSAMGIVIILSLWMRQVILQR